MNWLASLSKSTPDHVAHSYFILSPSTEFDQNALHIMLADVHQLASSAALILIEHFLTALDDI
jgi:hypothetical protein